MEPVLGHWDESSQWGRAYSEFVKNRPDSALALLDRIPKGDADEALALALRGRIETLRGELEAAKATLKAALNLNPKSGLAHYYMGGLHEIMLENAKAVDCLRACVALEPQMWQAKVDLAGNIAVGARTSEALRSAIDLCEECFDIEAAQGAVTYWQAYSYNKMGTEESQLQARVVLQPFAEKLEVAFAPPEVTEVMEQEKAPAEAAEGASTMSIYDSWRLSLLAQLERLQGRSRSAISIFETALATGLPPTEGEAPEAQEVLRQSLKENLENPGTLRLSTHRNHRQYIAALPYPSMVDDMSIFRLTQMHIEQGETEEAWQLGHWFTNHILSQQNKKKEPINPSSSSIPSSSIQSSTQSSLSSSHSGDHHSDLLLECFNPANPAFITKMNGHHLFSYTFVHASTPSAPNPLLRASQATGAFILRNYSRIQMSAGDATGAMASAKKALSIETAAWEAWMELIYWLREAGLRTEALETINKALAILPSALQPILRVYKLALLCDLDMGQEVSDEVDEIVRQMNVFELALGHERVAVGSEKLPPQLVPYRIFALQSQGDYAKAEEWDVQMQRGMDRLQLDLTAWLVFSRCAHRFSEHFGLTLGNHNDKVRRYYDFALKRLSKVAYKGSTFVHDMLIAAQQAEERMGNYDVAIEVYSHILDNTPNHTVARYLRASASAKKQKSEAAAKQSSKNNSMSNSNKRDDKNQDIGPSLRDWYWLSSILPSNARVILYLGVTMQERGYDEEAIKYYRAAQRALGPEESKHEAAALEGLTLLTQRQWQDGMAKLEQASSGPQLTDAALRVYGIALAGLSKEIGGFVVPESFHNLPRAISLLKQALSEDIMFKWDELQSLVTLSRALAIAGEAKEAQIILDRARVMTSASAANSDLYQPILEETQRMLHKLS